jgi:NADH-quinone oxidoreductase subunit I
MFYSMKEAIKNLFSKPATLDYPNTPDPYCENYRGLVCHNKDLCIFCRKCEKDCPADAIVFATTLEGQQSFHYNPYLCIFCGECVRRCPKPGSIYQDNVPAPPSTKECRLSWDETVKAAKDSQQALKREKARKRQEKAALEQQTQLWGNSGEMF